jgi:hypothetical protein
MDHDRIGRKAISGWTVLHMDHTRIGESSIRLDCTKYGPYQDR